MKLIKNIFLVYILFIINMIFSQNKFIDSNIITSNFGDSRITHFHTGIDVFGEDLDLFANEDVRVVFYNKNRKDDIKYGNGNFVILENSSKSLRYNYSHMKDNSINGKINEYKKGEVVGKSGNSGYSTGSHLHLEIEDIVNNKIINPISFFSINDTTKPVIEDVYFINNNNEKFSLRDGKKVVRGGKLFIKCFDRVDSYDNQLVPYELIVYINGEETASFNFSKMDKINGNLYLSDTDKNFQNLYLSNDRFVFFINEKYFLPDVYSIKIIVKDYNQNQAVFLTTFRVTFDK